MTLLSCAGVAACGLQLAGRCGALRIKGMVSTEFSELSVMRYLFSFFIIVPIAEMWILLEVGERLGALPTILLVMLTAAIGIALLRRQGVSTLARAQQRMQDGQMPAQEMIEGIALAVGGALLLTPGFMTDALGFACLIPASRRKLAALAVAQFARGRMSVHSESYTHSTRGAPPFKPAEPDKAAPSQPSNVIEGEYKELDD